MIKNLEPFTLHALLDNEIRSDKGNDIISAIDLINYYIKLFFSTNDKLNNGFNYNLKLNNTSHYEIFTDDYIIYPIGISSHAMCIILDNINNLLIVVNSGYKINNYHKEMNNNNNKYYPFLIFNKQCYNTFKFYLDIIKITNNTDDMIDTNEYIIIRNINNLYIFLHYINTNYISDIQKINDILKTLTYNYDNSNDELLKNFDLNSINQVSGSCTFYSLYMSLYYILFLIDKNYNINIINFKKLIIDNEIENIKTNLIVDENKIENIIII
jgi:hypothetical protein